eukprot:1451688-Amphidinium_carterae.1
MHPWLWYFWNPGSRNAKCVPMVCWMLGHRATPRPVLRPAWMVCPKSSRASSVVSISKALSMPSSSFRPRQITHSELLGKLQQERDDFFQKVPQDSEDTSERKW